MAKPSRPRVSFDNDEGTAITVTYTDKNGERVKAGFLRNTWDKPPKAIGDKIMSDLQRPPETVYHTKREPNQ